MEHKQKYTCCRSPASFMKSWEHERESDKIYGTRTKEKISLAAK
jgi:hypothetical protein